MEGSLLTTVVWRTEPSTMDFSYVGRDPLLCKQLVHVFNPHLPLLCTCTVMLTMVSLRPLMNFKRARVISGHSTGDTPPPGLSVVAVAAAGCTLGSGHGLGVMLELKTVMVHCCRFCNSSLCKSPVGEGHRNAVTMVFQITGCGFI